MLELLMIAKLVMVDIPTLEEKLPQEQRQQISEWWASELKTWNDNQTNGNDNQTAFVYTNGKERKGNECYERIVGRSQ